jgi:hypothetical protein
MDRLSMGTRMAASAAAVGSVWLVSALGFAIYLRDGRGIVLWLIWSTPFFVAGWIVVGLPLVVLGERTRRLPVIVLVAVAWVAGMALLLLPIVIVWWITPGGHAAVNWAFLRGWLNLGGALGAVTLALYLAILHRSAPERVPDANTTVD